MRIGLIMSTQQTPWARDVAVAFATVGHEVHVISPSLVAKYRGYLADLASLHRELEDSLRAHHIQVHHVGGGRGLAAYWRDSRGVRRCCRDLGIEVLLALYGGNSAALAYLSGVRPYVVYGVGSDVLLATGLKRMLNRYTYGRSAAFYANGNYLAEQARHLLPGKEVRALYLGTDTRRFVPAAEPPVCRAIINTRGFRTIYNNEYLLAALTHLDPGSFDAVTFTSTGPLLDTAREFAATHLPVAVRGKVRFLGGISGDELLHELQQAAIYVSVSRSDGTSISLLEALSCGLFPVLTDIPQSREWIVPGEENMLLVPLDQPEALAAALKRALTDEPMRLRARQINRQLILERADTFSNMGRLARDLEAIVRQQSVRDGSA